TENADNAAHADQYLQIVERLSKLRPPLLARIADVQILNNYCGLFDRLIVQLRSPLCRVDPKYLNLFNFSTNSCSIFVRD
ncbi:MAG TPA: hypothetical protein VGN95_15115, partial [Pyrinomonadaceae bacterium]|nr:hypothetical protein [Pyrinomonadaceae bacterium]